MDPYSVDDSKPYLVNAPLVTDSEGKNKRMVDINLTECLKVIASICSICPEEYLVINTVNDFKEWPHYLTVVKYHMNIPIIKEKLSKSMYYCVLDFANDVELMWANIIHYFATSHNDYCRLIDYRQKSREFIRTMSRAVKTTITIQKVHCIYCGAAAYPKYPLLECIGKCGRFSHLHCGSIEGGNWLCPACIKNNAKFDNDRRSLINLLSCFNDWQAESNVQ